jgi:hypothetical protein
VRHSLTQGHLFAFLKKHQLSVPTSVASHLRFVCRSILSPDLTLEYSSENLTAHRTQESTLLHFQGWFSMTPTLAPYYKRVGWDDRIFPLEISASSVGSTALRSRSRNQDTSSVFRTSIARLAAILSTVL